MGENSLVEFSKIEWKNLDRLRTFPVLEQLPRVDLPQVLAGEEGAARVKEYSAEMAAGLKYNYAAKAVDDHIIDALGQLAV